MAAFWRQAAILLAGSFQPTAAGKQRHEKMWKDEGNISSIEELERLIRTSWIKHEKDWSEKWESETEMDECS